MAMIIVTSNLTEKSSIVWVVILIDFQTGLVY